MNFLPYLVHTICSKLRRDVDCEERWDACSYADYLDREREKLQYDSMMEE